MEKKWESSSKPPRFQLNGEEFIEYEKIKELGNLLNKKRIAFVGPSPHLIGTNSGELIDSYDVVIRPGQMFSLPKEKTKDIGSRTDIVCHSFNCFERNVALENLEFFKSLKYIICSMVSTTDKKEHEEFFPKLITPVNNVDDRYLFKLFEEVGTTLNCGFAGLLTILNYDIKEVYITGMSFYNMGKYGNIYYKDYMDSVKKSGVMRQVENGNVRPIDARNDLHNQTPQIEYFKKIVKENPKLIKLDKYLKENLWKDE